MLKKLPKWLYVTIKTISTVIKTVLLVAVLPAMMLVNYTVDRSGFYHTQDEDKILAQLLLEGNNLDNYSGLDERRIHSLYIQGLEQPLDTVALGSSRILQLNRDIVGGDSFFNFGVSGGDLEDMLGTFYQLELSGMLPKNLILGIDPWLLNASPDASSPRSDKQLFNEFLNQRLGIPVSYVPFELEEEPEMLWEPLFDVAYFQGNVQYYLETYHLQKDGPPVVNENIFTHELDIKMQDGSVLYPQEYREVTSEEVEERARSMASSFVRMENFATPDKGRCNIFTKFINYVQSKDINVVFLLAPYHPLVYTYVYQYRTNYPGFFMTEPWFAEFARERNIPLYGSYNPFVVDCYQEDFYDGWHIRGEGLGRILPTMASIATAQKSGNAGSEWFATQQRITPVIAEKIVYAYYPAGPPYVLKATEDITIRGTTCFTLARYDSAGANARLVDRFAVTQDEGVIYRMNTAGQWVTEYIF